MILYCFININVFSGCEVTAFFANIQEKVEKSFVFPNIFITFADKS